MGQILYGSARTMVAKVERRLSRPSHKSLGFQTPNEVFHALLIRPLWRFVVERAAPYDHPGHERWGPPPSPRNDPARQGLPTIPSRRPSLSHSEARGVRAMGFTWLLRIVSARNGMASRICRRERLALFPENVEQPMVGHSGR